MAILGTILAGGQSRRMGGADKALIQLNGCRLIDHVYQRLEPQVDQVIVSGSRDYDLDVVVVADKFPEIKGPMCGILSALNYAQISAQKVVGILVVPVDAPFLPTDLGDQLIGDRIAFAAAGEELHPTFSYWPARMYQALLDHVREEESFAIRSCIDLFNVKKVQFKDAYSFTNINSPEDLKYTESINFLPN